MNPKYVYFFGAGQADGNARMKELLGGKGANLAEMTAIGLPVPAGLTISTDVCRYFLDHDGYPDLLSAQVEETLRRIEETMGRRFGDPENPLLVSVRSGAAISMPGMMDTILNLGINEAIVEGLARQNQNPRFAWDCYRRFLQMYAEVVLGLKAKGTEIDPFEALIEAQKAKRGIHLDTDLTEADLRELCASYRALVKDRLGIEPPTDPKEQLWGAIGAVFQSWKNPRAVSYRQLQHIPADLGTAVNIQAMVYGNMNEACATGVAFTRDPALGMDVLYGEFLTNAQGEDVVAGIRTPLPISVSQKEPGSSMRSLEEYSPSLYRELQEVRSRLETHFRDMQDLEFTIQDGRLWLLQTRTGKRTGMAAIRIAVEMVEDGLITPEEALLRIDPEQHLNQILQPVFHTAEKKKAIQEKRLRAKGLAAGPGAATGKICFSAEKAEAWAKKGEKVLLVRIETSPEDIRGMAAAQGILTSRGGTTSHAALVARQMGKVCVCGCTALDIEYDQGHIQVGDSILREGDWISIDGFTGEVFEGSIATQPSEVVRVLLEKTLEASQAPIYQLYSKLMTWIHKARRLQVWANADQPDQAQYAVAFGAQGIGLCRTEHMFFKDNRIDAVRQMILSTTIEGRRRALEPIRSLQEDDFAGLFRAMEGRPVIIRLLDPPLHEFLPNLPEQIADLSAKMGVPAEGLKEIVETLHEANPMLGHRGVRLLLTFPEIAEMQVTAILKAAIRVKREGIPVVPKIMIPIVSLEEEMKQMRALTCRIADQVLRSEGLSLPYSIGTMIELPRACVVADHLAKHADFFSFGTNDLTQTTFGFSRDDTGKFLPVYLGLGIVQDDPFQTLDRSGVGALMQIAVTKGCATRPDLHLGICGEHGGDPRSIHFCESLGLHYISCSPFRVPIALIAAAQAALRNKASKSA